MKLCVILNGITNSSNRSIAVTNIAIVIVSVAIIVIIINATIFFFCYDT